MARRNGGTTSAVLPAALLAGFLAVPLAALAARPAAAQFVGSFDSLNENAVPQEGVAPQGGQEGGPPAVPPAVPPANEAGDAAGSGEDGPPPVPPTDQTGTDQAGTDQTAPEEAGGGAPPPPPPAQTAYFVLVNGAQTGPFTAEEIKAKAASGEITAAALVWAEGMAQWTAIREVSELAALVPAAAKPPEPKMDASAYLKGGWGTAGQNVDLGDGTTGSIVVLSYFEGRSANLSIQIDTVAYGQPMRIFGEGGGPYEVKPLGGAKFQVVPYWNVSYYAGGMPMSVEIINEPMVFTVLDQQTMREDATGSTYVRQ